jgi:hypothetical protein
MGASVSKQAELSVAESDRLARKCKSLATAYRKCHRANPSQPQACSNLETSLVTCFASDLCPEAAEAHQKCYMSLMNTGGYHGKHDCEQYVAAMKSCLQKYKLYPFES